MWPFKKKNKENVNVKQSSHKSFGVSVSMDCYPPIRYYKCDNCNKFIYLDESGNDAEYNKECVKENIIDAKPEQTEMEKLAEYFGYKIK